MLDTHSDYALNKIDKEAIVCPCASGDHIRLTREDFASEEEFLRWKKWSDADYRETEVASKNDNRCLSLDDQRDTPIPSTEETIIAACTDAEMAEQRRQRLEQVKDRLTRKQFRRLWMLHVENLSVDEIAAAEKVSARSIYTCLEIAKRRM